MDLDSTAYHKICLFNLSNKNFEEYLRIRNALSFLRENMIIKHQKYDALIFMIHSEKYLKTTQETFLRMDILVCVESFINIENLALN